MIETIQLKPLQSGLSFWRATVLFFFFRYVERKKQSPYQYSNKMTSALQRRSSKALIPTSESQPLNTRARRPGWMDVYNASFCLDGALPAALRDHLIIAAGLAADLLAIHIYLKYTG